MALEKIVQLANLNLVYDERGQGRPLLFIHGFPFNKAMWQPQLDGLTDLGWLLAPDLRGFGGTEPGEPASLEQLADDCLGFLQALGATRPAVVCGLSMGGYIALAFYRRHPDQVAGLILAATRAGVDSEAGKAARDQSIAAALADGAAAVAEAMLPKLLAPGSYAANPGLIETARSLMESASVAGIVAAQQAMKERLDSTDLLPNIKAPVLILHGTDDQLIPLSEAEAMQTAIPQAHLRLLPQAGHLLNLEQPAPFNQAVRDFVAALA
jgi:3-oxoadipate enol-lactonase